MRPHSVLRSCRLIVAMAVVAMVAACGQSKPKSDAAGAVPASSDGAADVKANLQQLSYMPLETPLRWDFTEGVLISESPELSKLGGAKANVMTTTGGKSFHRLGVAGKFPDGQRTYHVTVWVKGTPGVDAMLEARGGAMTSPTMPADYGRTFFDLANNSVQANPMNTPPPNFTNAAITPDGDWKKLSVDMTTRDGWLYLVINMTTKGQHVFPGAPGLALTLGGIEVTPAS